MPPDCFTIPPPPNCIVSLFLFLLLLVPFKTRLIILLFELFEGVKVDEVDREVTYTGYDEDVDIIIIRISDVNTGNVVTSLVATDDDVDCLL